MTGLPQMLFDSALLWQPYKPITRRTRKGEQEACLPSWSWVGWHGDISFPSWRSGYDYIRKNPEYVSNLLQILRIKTLGLTPVSSVQEYLGIPR